jgi:ribosomal protein S6
MEINDERRVYELGYHMVSTLTEEELLKEVDALRGAISELGGNFITEGEPALMDLAYTMYIGEGGKNTKYDKAYFGWMKFGLEPGQISHLQKEIIDENKNILRHLLIKTVAEDTRAQVNLEQLTEVKSNETIAPAPKVEKPKDDVVEESTPDEQKEAAKDLDETIDKLLEE